MNTSESIAKIAPALLKAQKAITFAAKDSTNPHFRSKYADLPSVIDACKKPLNDNGIAFMQFLAPSDTGFIAIATRLQHESGEWIESVATCPLPKSDPQGYGSACTYVRRYSLASAVGLYQDDDDGQAASKPVSRITPIAGSLDALSKEDQQKAKDIAAEIVDLWTQEKTTAAYEAFYEADLSNEMKLGVWEVMQPNSKVRNGIKKISEANKQKAA